MKHSEKPTRSKWIWILLAFPLYVAMRLFISDSADDWLGDKVFIARATGELSHMKRLIPNPTDGQQIVPNRHRSPVAVLSCGRHGIDRW